MEKVPVKAGRGSTLLKKAARRSVGRIWGAWYDTAMSLTRRPRRWRYFLNLALAALISLYPINLVVGLVTVGNAYAHPKREPVCCDTPATAGLAYEDVAFTSTEGLTLRGWWVPPRNGATLLLAHGIDSNRAAMLRHLLLLAGRGYGVLAFDLRAHGASDGERNLFRGDDVLAAVAFLKQRPEVDASRIGALGFSLGAMLVADAAARSADIRAVVLDEPGGLAFQDMAPAETVGEFLYVPFDLVFFPLLPMWTGTPNPPPMTTLLTRLTPRPVLIIGQESRLSRQIRHLYEAAAEPKTYLAFPEGPHGFNIVNDPDRYLAEVGGFFDRALLQGEP